MVGRKRINPSTTLFIKKGQLIAKDVANRDQRASQPNDWVAGDVGNNVLASWGKYKGGDKKNPASYEMDSQINRDAFPNI